MSVFRPSYKSAGIPRRPLSHEAQRFSLLGKAARDTTHHWARLAEDIPLLWKGRLPISTCSDYFVYISALLPRMSILLRLSAAFFLHSAWILAREETENRPGAELTSEVLREVPAGLLDRPTSNIALSETFPLCLSVSTG